MKQAKKSNKGFYLLLAAVAIAGIAAVSYLASRSGAARVTEIDPTLPPVEAVGYVLGSPTAPVEVLEILDFECPGCAQYATVTGPDVKQRLVETGQVRLRVMDIPLNIHQNAWTASLAAACANAQGKFWPMHDALFQAQDRWNSQATSNPLGVIKGLAANVGIDADALAQCVEARTYQANIQAHMKEAERLGIGSTPSFVIGGKLVPGAVGYDTFKAYVDSAAMRAASAPASPSPTSGSPATGAPAAGAAKAP